MFRSSTLVLRRRLIVGGLYRARRAGGGNSQMPRLATNNERPKNNEPLPCLLSVAHMIPYIRKSRQNCCRRLYIYFLVLVVVRCSCLPCWYCRTQPAEDLILEGSERSVIRVRAGTPYSCLMLKNQRFSSLFRHYAKHHGLRKDDLAYYFTEELQNEDTPETVFLLVSFLIEMIVM